MVASAQGLDVSNYQGQYNWANAVKAMPGLAFGIYRLTQGLGAPGTVSPDPDARWNNEQIRAERLYHGAYHFLNPNLNGALQAQYFVATHATIGLGTADMLWLDNETAGKTAAETAACAVAFMHELDVLAPHNPRGVYTFIDFAKYGYCAGLEGYPLWLAFPSAKAPMSPPPWNHLTFWQWGLRNGVDADAFMGTVAQLTAWLNSFSTPAVKAPQTITATGLKTFGQLAAEYGVTVPGMLHATINKEGPSLSGGIRHLLNSAEVANERPLPGTKLWTS